MKALRKSLAYAVAALLLAVTAAVAAAKLPSSGSVEISYTVSIAQMGKQTMKGIVYFSGNRARVEQEGTPGFMGTPAQSAEGEELRNVVIVDGDAMEAYAIVPGMNYAIKFRLSNPSFAEGAPAGNPTMALDREKYPEGAEFKNLGARKYKGKTVTVYSVTYKHEGQMTASLIYVDSKGLPVFMSGKTGNISYEATFTNYRFGQQEPSLFRLPEGMQVMDLSQYESAISG